MELCLKPKRGVSLLPEDAPFCDITRFSRSQVQTISPGLQRPLASGATRPQLWQEYFIAAIFSLQIWLVPTSDWLQYEQEIFSWVGLQR